MDIDKIKQELEKEVSAGNLNNYKKLYSFCVKIYKTLNKDKVHLWNDNYNKKCKGNPSNKENNNIIHKGNPSINDNKLIKDKGNPLDIF